MSNEICPKKILVVDDDRFERTRLSECLKQAGFEVIVANDGASGLVAVKSHSVDLVILDINMPNLDGWDFLKTILDGYCPKVPIVVHSAYSFPGDEARARAAGCTAFFPKPASLSALLSCVNANLSITLNTP